MKISIKERAKAQLDRLCRSRLGAVVGVGRAAVQGWLADGGPRLAAALAFYTAISLAPLLTLIVSVVGIAFGDEAARGYLIDEIANLTDQRAASFIQTLISNAGDKPRGAIAGGISLAVLVWGSTKLFYQLQESLNLIWNVTDSSGAPLVEAAKRRLVAFGMTLVAAFLLLVSLLVNAALSFAIDSVKVNLPGGDWAWLVASSVISLATITGLFLALYKGLPSRRIPWRSALWGAAVAALLFSVGKELIGLYLSRQDTALETSGALMAVLLWVYFSAQIFFFGAEISKATAMRERAPSGRGARAPESLP